MENFGDYRLDFDTSDSNLQTDRIVRYFIDSANEKTDLCANCDQVRFFEIS